MEGSLVTEFVNQTGIDNKTAQMFLQAYNWDLKISLEHWFSTQASRAVDRSETRKLARGISRATDNEHLVFKARDAIAKDFENNQLFKVNNFHVETPNATFLLLNFYSYNEEFKCFLERDLIEKSVMASLEASMKLNWWCSDLGNHTRLWPLSTTGDGNCLLHAAALSTYGFHDRNLTLRQALYRFITGSESAKAIKRRWRWQQTKANSLSGVQFSEMEWEQEWNMIVDIASAKKRKSTQQGIYESLEEIHIFVLAHVLQRVIIVISETVLKDSYNQPLAPIHFGGIYCPLECDEKKCRKNPIFLTYDMAHFSSLVFMEIENSNSEFIYHVPLTTCDGDLLPIQFAVDPGPDFNWYLCSDLQLADITEKDQLNILKTYLSLIDPLSGSLSPENESEDEIERRFIECAEATDDDGNNMFGNKNKAAKQLQTLSKQMGSIGKSMSKKLKRNFGSLTKLASKPKTKEEAKKKLLCAEVRLIRHPYQNEMIQNYLKYATDKFIKEYFVSKFPEKLPEEKDLAVREGLMKCVNSACTSYATCLSSYMCNRCYQAQRKQELNKLGESYFGIGKSKFYREPDMASYSAVKDMPNSNLKNDQTLYLSNSTFFNDANMQGNNNTMLDLNKNLSAMTIADSSKDNVLPEPHVPCTKTATPKTIPVEQLNKKAIPLEKLISECDFGSIVIPESSKPKQQQKNVSQVAESVERLMLDKRPESNVRVRPPEIPVVMCNNYLTVENMPTSNNPVNPPAIRDSGNQPQDSENDTF